LERGSRMHKVHAQRGRREKEWERRETETVFYGRRSKRVVAVGRGQALVSCNLIPGKKQKQSLRTLTKNPSQQTKKGRL
jgi:hypothetical protein